MSTMTDKLAAALSAMRNYYGEGMDENDEQEMRLHNKANEILAEYDAQKSKDLIRRQRAEIKRMKAALACVGGA